MENVGSSCRLLGQWDTVTTISRVTVRLVFQSLMLGDSLEYFE